MSESLVLLPSMAYLASTMATILADQIKGLFSRYNIFGICCLSQASIDFVVKNTSGDSVAFINLDQEIMAELDDDDKKKAKESGLQLNRVIYTKGKKVVSAVQDILMGSSRAVQHIVFFSSDYKLLKYLSCNKISYFVPSDNYLQENPGEVIDPSLRSDLIKRKISKVTIYNHRNDFLDSICSKFGTKIKI